jgi:Ca2+-transporting ATPase
MTIEPDRTDLWHALGAEQVAARWGSDPVTGLSSDEAGRRLRLVGPNRLAEAEPTPWWLTLVGQFRSPLIYILMIAGLITVLLGEYLDAVVIAAVLGLNASIGFFQERKAEASVLALMQLVSPTAHVVRDGVERTVASRELVPGDVVLLESGARVPADLRLVATASFEIDESLLTGESLPVGKQPAALPEATQLADRVNMAYSGSIVSRGRATGIVVATGDRTELGRIAEEVRGTAVLESPLQERMRRFAHLIGAVIVVAAALTFALGLLLGEDLREMIRTAAALAVAAIPEGLPIVLTVALALGVRRMARRNAIVRHLPAVETLGSTSLIGSDKTGTLTENRMTVEEVRVNGAVLAPEEAVGRSDAQGAAARAVPDPGAPALDLALLAGVLANEAALTSSPSGVEVFGDPTETAFLLSAHHQGFDVEACRREWEQVAVIPFESERRYAASFRVRGGQHAVFVKGAPERLLEMCAHRATADGTLTPLDPAEVLDSVAEMASRGLRVLATAYLVLDAPPADPKAPERPTGLVFLGLHGLMDPPRAGVRDAIDGCRRAGQRVIMITGDHAATARAIARQLGIVDRDDAPVLTGHDLDALDDDDLADRVGEVSVFARVSPEHKLRIVRAAQARGDVVAVTGDGVNDAPALRAADIGVAMGREGTDVAREAADIVLADDNFVSIYAAVEEGRVTFDNVRKVTFFLVSTGFGTFIIIPIAMVLGWPLILLPAQLLWLNLVTKGLQDLALAFEPGEPDVLDHPPRARGEPVITGPLWWRTLLTGSVMAVVTLAMFHWARDQPGHDIAEARSVALSTLVVLQALHLGSCRSEFRSVFRTPPLSNRFLLGAQLAALVVSVAALYLPPTQFVLRVEPIGLDTWVRIVVASLSVILIVELDKAVRRWRARSGTALARSARSARR